MHNMSCSSLSSECSQKYQTTSCTSQSGRNRFIYVKQHSNEQYHFSNGSQKVLVNPHFKSKVFVNPKFSDNQPKTIYVNPHVKNLKVPILGNKQCLKSQPHQQNVPLQSTNIHINPSAKSVQIPININHTASQTVHINPNFKNPSILNSVLLNNASSTFHVERKENVPSELLNKAIVLTRTKLIRTSSVNKNKKTRRNSVKSKYKIVKSSHSLLKGNNLLKNDNEENKSDKNRYKIDHRRRKSLSVTTKTQKKYVYINRFLSISDLAKNYVIKNPPANTTKNVSVVNISGVIYRKSRTSLRKASLTSVSLKKSPTRTVQLSKYKLVKMPVMKKVITRKTLLESKDKTLDKACENNLVLRKFKIVRKSSTKRIKTAKVSSKILRKCNIPCPYYKKYGLCKGKENGKCFRKHDPDQIALCTRFLQGACIKEKCLLSHNVSPEKMPTCKYYLEGFCSRENCPYLHVKINPKAEVCRNFVEGFCIKAAECDKRHQYLCPDYEKYGNCLKQRCPYPHGKMVRNYMSNKTKFAKKSSELDKKITKRDKNMVVTTKSCSNPVKANVCKNVQVKENQRYYDEKKSKIEGITVESTTLEGPENKGETGKSSTKNFVGLQSRPKLGILPTFIPFVK